MSYRINEIFASLQGEGGRAGSPNIFVRFSGCNLTCRPSAEEENQQFICDTEFVSGRSLSALDIISEAKRIAPEIKWMILTGGEPLLQVDGELTAQLHEAGYSLAVETNGTQSVERGLERGLDYVCVSPKVAEHALKVKWANEVKYVRHSGQGIPRPSIQSDLKFISPAFDAEGLRRDNLIWCIELVKKNPDWRLSVQQHKLWGVR